jgi:uncharacterized membrane protein (DUF106 family)
MKMKIIALLVLAALSFSVLGAGAVLAQGENNPPDVTTLIKTIDASVSSLRSGNENSAKTLIGRASDMYSENFSPSVGENSQLDNTIKAAFNSLKNNPVEENIFALKATILQVFPLPPLYAYSLFIILGITVAVSLITTLLSKHLVNWEIVRKNKAEISKFQRELREAMKKRDMKEVHKLQQRQGEINKLSGEIFIQNLKPTIIYFIPMILIWITLLNVYSGWVVAWLPFSIDLPFLGRLVAFGVGWWYILPFMGLSQIFRKIMIRD